MAALNTPADLTLREPRIEYDKFRSVLRVRRSPAFGQAEAIWEHFLSEGVDPSFALGQFLVESNYGTAGWAEKTKSWGNMTWDRFNLPQEGYHLEPPATNGFDYIAFDTWLDGAEEYTRWLQRYATTKDPRYGEGFSDTIDKATARWAGKPLDSEAHLSYVSVLVNAMNTYEYAPNEFRQQGDIMIFPDPNNLPATPWLLRVQNGTPLYAGTAEDPAEAPVIKLASFGEGKPSEFGDCRFFGPAGQRWSDADWQWGTVLVVIRERRNPANPDSPFIKVPRMCYVANPRRSALIRLSV